MFAALTRFDRHTPPAFLVTLCLLFAPAATPAQDAPEFRLATFAAEVTCPLGHPLIAGLCPPAKEIVDPLYASGFVLLGAGPPVVLCAVDWCEVRNRSYDHWREALAGAAGTSRERVLLTCLHQHDAPVTDAGAEELLAGVGLGGAMFDTAFERKCVSRVAAALKKSLKEARRVTHVGTGQAKVDRLASNRRVVLPDGRVTYARGSSSGGTAALRDAPDGTIDPWLKVLSFWDGDTPVAALSCYATHPMSYYGRGGVSADFVGMARDRMQRRHPRVFHVYAAGCSGDLTAGKYNDGSPANRAVLADRLFDGMQRAWAATARQPLRRVDFRSTRLELAFRPGEAYTADGLRRRLADVAVPTAQRPLAAMGLSSRGRVESGQPIDFPCVDFGPAQLVLFPGEAFVDYQLLAQRLAPDSFVVSMGYGECWPGYVPGPQGFRDDFTDQWYWCAPGSDERVRAALGEVLRGPRK